MGLNFTHNKRIALGFFAPGSWPKVFALFAIFTHGFVFAGENSYDEIFQADGTVRPQYAEVWKEFKKLKKKDVNEFLRQSRSDFKGDNKLNPIPRIITESEYSELKRGVEQRGTALRMLIEDHYSGKKSYLGKVIPADVMTRILERSGDLAWEGKVPPNRIAFPYGPDIIRDASGAWRVLEDNPGYIGGLGDLEKARETLFKRMPAYQRALHPVDDPSGFFRKYFQDIREHLPVDAKSIVVVQTPPYPDNEEVRLRKIFQTNGAEIVTPQSKAELKFKSDGVYLDSQSYAASVSQKVGYVILNGEHHELDSSDPSAFKRLILERSKHIMDELLDSPFKRNLEAALTPDPKTGAVDTEKVFALLKGTSYESDLLGKRHRPFPGLTEAILSGKVQSNYAPGLDFIGDKEFNVYVEDLIRHYLKAEPILKNVRTQKFANKSGQLDAQVLNEVFANPQKYVIKSVDGRGGDGVWVGAKISLEKFNESKALVLEHPSHFIAQDYTPLSEHNGYITDLRMLSFVNPWGVRVSETPWGRSLPIQGDGKVNLSSSGLESAVVIVKDPVLVERKKLRSPSGSPDCSRAFSQSLGL